MNAHPRTEFAELMERAGLDINTAAELLDVSTRTVRRNMKGEGKRVDQLRLEKLREAADARCTVKRPDGFRFIDLFAGIGGLRLPFEAIGGQCVFTAEWDRFSRETYSANFPEPADSDHVFAEDVRPYAEAPVTIPPHDLLLAGFPCQPFSIAGVSKKNALGRPHGFLCNTQGTLFYDLARIIDHHRPPAFLLENVKNLERHDGGKTFVTIMHVLENKLGYRVFHRVISSTPWVPQKRERIFIVGFKDHSMEFDFDQLAVPEGDGPVLGAILDTEVDPKYTLTDHMWTYLKGYKEKHRSAGNGFGYSLFGPGDVARTLSARYYKDGSEILIEQKGNRPRRLTPRECARLMGFEKPGRTDWKIPVSDTQAYRQFGNAVVVPVVKAVARLMQMRIAEAMELDGREVSAAIQPQLPLDERRACATREMPAEYLEIPETALAGA
ncbi:MAG: DNA (cytosine-5-)-methyltransferase [Rhodospirillales bacterium]|nr:DNA (cytosine-5-)-methyltransferase [Rhodospirillales bacterium]